MLTLVSSPKQHLPKDKQHSLHKKNFSADQLSDSLHIFFLIQTTLDSRKKKGVFLNQDLPVLHISVNTYLIIPRFQRILK